jgi:hypothetical protein
MNEHESVVKECEAMRYVGHVSVGGGITDPNKYSKISWIRWCRVDASDSGYDPVAMAIQFRASNETSF